MRHFLLEVFLGAFDFWFGLILLFICASFATAFYYLYRMVMACYRVTEKRAKSRKAAA